MRRQLSIITALIFCASSAEAAVELGVGTTSSTSGRLMPAASATADFNSFALTGTSTGSRTNVYYLSAYTLGIVKRWSVEKFWWGDMTVGFGAGVTYSQYGYRDSPDASTETKTDFTGGPMFQFRWSFLGPVYLGLDALFGMKYPQGVLALALQDVVAISIGVSL